MRKLEVLLKVLLVGSALGVAIIKSLALREHIKKAFENRVSTKMPEMMERCADHCTATLDPEERRRVLTACRDRFKRLEK